MQNLTISSNEVTELVAGLNRVARNLWWTWSQEAQELFQELSPRGWQNLYHNAVAILHEVSEQELRARLQDHEFANRVREVLRRFNAYINDQKTWCVEHAPELKKNPVAYFSAEFGFHESLPIAAGGDGQTFVKTKFGAEVCDRIFLKLRSVLNAPGFLVVDVGVESAQNLADAVRKFMILQPGAKFLFGNFMQNRDRVVVEILPAARRKLLKK